MARYSPMYTSTPPRIRRGDTVRVLNGRDRGKQGKVLAVLRDRDRVIVEGVNIVKKHIRPKQRGQKGQRVTVAASIHISNVQLIDPSTGKGTRVRITREGGVRGRVAATSGKTIA